MIAWIMFGEICRQLSSISTPGGATSPIAWPVEEYMTESIEPL